MNDAVPLLDKIVAASGLSPIFARGAITRALRRAGVRDDELTRVNARGALPEIRKAIQPFLATSADEAMKAIEAVIE